MQLVVTPWRDASELLEVRRDFFGGDEDGRERAVSKVLAWRTRKYKIPLLLESTADIVDAVLQDERGMLPHNALRLVYATAISRFITGLSDTQTDLTRDRPTWFPPQKTLQFPLALRETRHCIVHRHLPSLGELKRAAKESLEWLWEWYWSHLDVAFTVGRDGDEGTGLEVREVRQRVQGVLKSYVKERKGEIKRREKGDESAKSAVSSYLYVDAASSIKRDMLLELLVEEKAILPADKKLGTSMSGAFLIWTPVLRSLSKSQPDFCQTLIERLIGVTSAPSSVAVAVEVDPVKEAMCEWVLHILSSSEWEEVRQHSREPSLSGRTQERRMLDNVLSICFTTPTFWTLKLAETLLADGRIQRKESWLAILEAAKNETAIVSEETAEQAALPAPSAVEDMEVEDIEVALPISEASTVATKTKSRGPQKKIGLWRPQPIGFISEGWEMDE